MVKTAFADAELTKKLGLTSANSINIGRLLPQMTYYTFAANHHFAQIGQKPTIIVPSGNFGNITAGLFVKKWASRFNALLLQRMPMMWCLHILPPVIIHHEHQCKQFLMRWM
jgi:threonine synthase